jgi:hypothetical protein
MYDEDLINLDEWLRRLKIEYHVFFNGNRKKPPDDLRIRLERLVKKLSESPDMSPSQRFRFNTLIARFYVYRDLWRRTMLIKEMGEEVKPAAASIPETARITLKPPITAVRITISDPEIEEQKIRQLYNELLRIKKGETKESAPSYQQFAKYIAAQTRSIRERHNCPAVAFAIALEEDAIRFTAVAENP